jgi:hypothetical protein
VRSGRVVEYLKLNGFAALGGGYESEGVIGGLDHQDIVGHAQPGDVPSLYRAARNALERGPLREKHLDAGGSGAQNHRLRGVLGEGDGQQIG